MWLPPLFDTYCPECGEGVDRESVDVGVGILNGPYGCFECGWCEWTVPEKSDHYDPHGNYWPRGTIKQCFMNGKSAVHYHVKCGKEDGICELVEGIWVCKKCGEKDAFKGK